MAQQDTGSEADKERLGSCELENQGKSLSRTVGKPVCLMAQPTI